MKINILIYINYLIVNPLIIDYQNLKTKCFMKMWWTTLQSRNRKGDWRQKGILHSEEKDLAIEIGDVNILLDLPLENLNSEEWGRFGTMPAIRPSGHLEHARTPPACLNAARTKPGYLNATRTKPGCHQNAWKPPSCSKDAARMVGCLEWSPKKYSLWLNDCFKQWIVLYQSVNSAHCFTYFYFTGIVSKKVLTLTKWLVQAM